MKQKLFQTSSIVLALFSIAFVSACDSRETAVTPQANQQSAPEKRGPPLDPSKKVFDDLMKSAQTGDVKSQARLGNMYLFGDGVTKNVDTAMEWFSKAAQQDDVDSQFWMGWALADGIGLAKDARAAIDWYHKAAAAGHGRAQDALGFSYSNGKGVPEDKVKAKEWYQKAYDTFSKNAVAGDKDACNYLGSMFEHGNSVVRKNPDEAIKWYEKAVSLGYKQATYSLGSLLLEQKKVERALPYLEKSASEGDLFSQLTLARTYLHGDGIPKNSTIAAKWYRMASAHDGMLAAPSKLQLGVMYLTGEGVDKDIVLAYALLNLAAVHEPFAAQIRDSIKIAATPETVSDYEKRKIRYLTQDQKREAEELSSSWKPGKPLDRVVQREGGDLRSNLGLKKTRTGTAFYVTKDGMIVTNSHITQSCKEVRRSNGHAPLKVLVQDRSNDLALLQIEGSASSIVSIAPESTKLRQGEDIAVFGYPLDGLLSSSGNMTPGVVSALTGLGNNTTQFQITAPIQPGSSGSPVFNRKGDVVGVVMMKLSDSGMVQATGQIAQNANFAISGQTLRAFLELNKVAYKLGGGVFSLDMNNADIADLASKSTTVIECWQ